MRELLILALIAAAGYLAYDDYYKQRPALLQALNLPANQIK
jgi:hypothetical protein